MMDHDDVIEWSEEGIETEFDMTQSIIRDMSYLVSVSGSGPGGSSKNSNTMDQIIWVWDHL